MKKSVILIIFAVYILSVCVVGFFGIKVRMYNETVNVESVQITLVTYEDGTKIEIGEDENGNPVARHVCKNAGETVTFKVYYQVNPANATDPSTLLIYDKTNPKVSVSRVPGEQAVLITFNSVTSSSMLDITIANHINTSICDSILLSVIWNPIEF